MEGKGNVRRGRGIWGKEGGQGKRKDKKTESKGTGSWKGSLACPRSAPLNQGLFSNRLDGSDTSSSREVETRWQGERERTRGREGKGREEGGGGEERNTLGRGKEGSS